MRVDVKTVTDSDGIPVLLIIKDKNELLICEADNMGSHIKLQMAAAPTLVDTLLGLR